MLNFFLSPQSATIFLELQPGQPGPHLINRPQKVATPHHQGCRKVPALQALFEKIHFLVEICGWRTCKFTRISVCPSVCLSVFHSVGLSVCLSVCVSVCLCVWVSVCLCVCVSMCLCVCVSVCRVCELSMIWAPWPAAILAQSILAPAMIGFKSVASCSHADSVSRSSTVEIEAEEAAGI